MIGTIMILIATVLCITATIIIVVNSIRATRAIETYNPLYSDIIAALLKDRIVANFDEEETDDPYEKLDDKDE